MINMPAPEGCVTLVRKVQCFAFQFFEHEYKHLSERPCGIFDRYRFIQVIPDYHPRTGERMDTYWVSNDGLGQHWRINDGDWIVIDAMNLSNRIKMTDEEFRAADFEILGENNGSDIKHQQAKILCQSDSEVQVPDGSRPKGSGDKHSEPQGPGRYPYREDR